MFNWQYENWPNFTYEIEEIQSLVVSFAEEFGEMNGVLLGLSNEVKQETLLQVMLSEAIKTSEIEGELMSREDVMSSIKNNLGLYKTPRPVKDKKASGIAQLMVSVRDSFQEHLSTNLLKEWHGMLMQGYATINSRVWRIGKEPMQIVSGAYAREVVHYEAPPSERVPAEMDAFVNWFNKSQLQIDGQIAEALLKASIAHLYFESIHPFEDGNGRIGRALVEFTLSKCLQRPVLLSVSSAIEKNRKIYYKQLKLAQAGLEITPWLKYFITIILEAQLEVKELVQFTLKKTQFFDAFKAQLNERQLLVLNKMFAAGVNGFEGGMSAKKYIAIAKTSKATATRDLQQLTELGALLHVGQGRSVSYTLSL